MNVAAAVVGGAITEVRTGFMPMLFSPTNHLVSR